MLHSLIILLLGRPEARYTKKPKKDSCGYLEQKERCRVYYKMKLDRKVRTRSLNTRRYSCLGILDFLLRALESH